MTAMARSVRDVVPDPDDLLAPARGLRRRVCRVRRVDAGDAKPERTLRFVWWLVNEEPPYFQGEDMGSRPLM
jgi:hypothetical protein